MEVENSFLEFSDIIVGNENLNTLKKNINDFEIMKKEKEYEILELEDKYKNIVDDINKVEKEIESHQQNIPSEYISSDYISSEYISSEYIPSEDNTVFSNVFGNENFTRSDSNDSFSLFVKLDELEKEREELRKKIRMINISISKIDEKIYQDKLIKNKVENKINELKNETELSDIISTTSSTISSESESSNIPKTIFLLILIFLIYKMLQSMNK
jgi:predicted  nucleic acid-binding Zn-ribbon protein